MPPSRVRRAHRAALTAALTVGLTLLLAAAAGCSGDDDAASGTTVRRSTTTTTAPTTTSAPTTGGGAGTTSVPPATLPGGGEVGGTSIPPVGEGEAAPLGGGVTASLTGSRTLDVEAHSPGETSGPAVAVTIELDNASSAPVDLSQVAVTATAADGSPAIGVAAEPAEPLMGSLAPGGKRSGTWVFRTPSKDVSGVVVGLQAGFSPNSVGFRL